MPVICPTVTAENTQDFFRQLQRLMPFASRVHIDLMDGQFAPTTSPNIEDIRLPKNILSDIHLMYQNPMQQLPMLKKLRPNMVIIHAEADVHHALFAAQLHAVGIKSGLAFLASTDVADYQDVLSSFDQALIFSGNLGHHGGVADLSLLQKVKHILCEHSHIEIAWDGGINDQNAKQMVTEGVEVLNVGGFIQNSSSPQESYGRLSDII